MFDLTGIKCPHGVLGLSCNSVCLAVQARDTWLRLAPLLPHQL